MRVALASLFALCTHQIHALIAISPPTSANDYRRLASLVATTFDAPTRRSKNDNSLASKIEALSWTVGGYLAEEYTYKRYVSTARKMRGKKYCLLLAKEIRDNDSMDDDEVVGMVEMGMSLCPVSLQDTDATNDGTGLRPTPTLGVLCVKSTHQKRGIGQSLVQKCEKVAAEVWNDQFVCVDVEPDNQNALSFFQSCGYEGLVDGSGEAQMRNTTVSTRRTAESRPHYLLRRSLIRDENEDATPGLQ